MTRCHSQWEVVQDGKGKEEMKPRARKQDRARVAGGQDYEVRYTGEEDQEVGSCGEEGWHKPQARRAPARTLGTTG